MRQPFRGWEQPSAQSQKENGDPSLTTARNWIQPTPRDSRKHSPPELPKRNAACGHRDLHPVRPVSGLHNCKIVNVWCWSHWVCQFVMAAIKNYQLLNFLVERKKSTQAVTFSSEQWLCIFVVACSAEDQMQALAYARQALHHTAPAQPSSSYGEDYSATRNQNWR